MDRANESTHGRVSSRSESECDQGNTPRKFSVAGSYTAPSACSPAERLRRLWAKQLDARKVGTWMPSRPAFDHLSVFLSQRKPCYPPAGQCGRSAIKKKSNAKARRDEAPALSIRDLSYGRSVDDRSESISEPSPCGGALSATRQWSQLLSEAVLTSEIYPRVSSEGPTPGKREPRHLGVGTGAVYRRAMGACRACTSARNSFCRLRESNRRDSEDCACDNMQAAPACGLGRLRRCRGTHAYPFSV